MKLPYLYKHQQKVKGTYGTSFDHQKTNHYK